MSENKSDESRRKILKSIAAGSGAVIAGKSLPDNWSKPVVDSVLLPVHAQTSQVSPLSCISTGAPFGSNTPPGPDVDVSGGSVPVPYLISVTPAPVAPNDNFDISLYIDGVLAQGPTNLPLAPDGTYVGNGILGSADAGSVIEFRSNWQAEECSLFWNLLPVVPPQTAGSTPSSL